MRHPAARVTDVGDRENRSTGSWRFANTGSITLHGTEDGLVIEAKLVKSSRPGQSLRRVLHAGPGRLVRGHASEADQGGDTHVRRLTRESGTFSSIPRTSATQRTNGTASSSSDRGYRSRATILVAVLAVMLVACSSPSTGPI